MKRQRVLITGAAGRIGSLLAQHWRESHELVLIDKHAPATTTYARFQQCDLCDQDSLPSLFEGIDTVIHLAADPNPNASWQSLLPNNIEATHNVLEAAADAGCHRVILASSLNAVAGYPADVQVKTTMPVAPANLYGATKAFGEAMGRYYADQRGLSVLCLRLGAVIEVNDARLVPGHPLLDSMLTREDLLNLYDACLASDDIHFGIFHGISDNRFKRLDISDTRSILHYQPCDDTFVLTGMVGPDRQDHLYESH